MQFEKQFYSYKEPWQQTVNENNFHKPTFEELTVKSLEKKR